MARFEAQTKLGFYPLWNQMIELIGHHLIWPDSGKVLLFDPCAGEGEAIETFRNLHGKERTIVYAIEFAENRGAGCAKRFNGPDDQVIQGVSCITVEFPRKSSSEKLGAQLMLFNPPYDDDREYGRESLKFAKVLLEDKKALAPGGVFISVLPLYDTRLHLKQYLSLFTHCSCFKLPEPYFSKWQQVIFMGTMRGMRLGHLDADDLIAWEHHLDDLPTLGAPDEREMPKYGVANPHYQLPSYPFGQSPARMKNPVFNVLDVVDAVNLHGMLRSQAFLDQIYGAPPPPIQVIRPMSQGHLALALAAGMLNGHVLDMRPEGGSVVGIRGSSVKVETKTDSYETDDGVEVATMTEQVKTSVFAVDLDTGKPILYELVPDKADETLVEDADEWLSKQGKSKPEFV